MSLSARRAWIEIICTALKKYPVILSLSARRAWIEIARPTTRTPGQYRSLSARRAWIEIALVKAALSLLAVALRKESVDRNLLSARSLNSKFVALRKESVDRNVIGLDTNIKPVGRSPQGERG